MVTISRNVDLKQYLPEVIKHNREFEALHNAQNPQIHAIWQALEVVFNNEFLESLTEYGCQRWEGILNIIPQKSETLESRRKNIWIRFNENLPYTWKRLVKLMDAICGENGYTMELYHNEYFLDVSVKLTEQNLNGHMIKQIVEMFQRVLPANIAYEKKFNYDSENAIVKVGSFTTIAQYIDVLPYMPTEYQYDCDIFTSGVICVGIHMEIKEG
mgnify:CR=1 FL=1